MDTQPPYHPGPQSGTPPAGGVPQPPPPYYGPPPKKSKVGLILAVIGGALALCCVGGVAVAMYGTTKPTVTPEAVSSGDAARPAKPKAQERKAAGLNQPVRDGKFEFVVTGVTCGEKTVGNEFLKADAQGVFCLVSVTVRNIGDRAQFLDGASQKAYDAKGTEFSNSSEAEIYLNEDKASTFYNEINPGNTVKGKLVFDVPESTKLASIELHDSTFSGGVKVRLA